MIQVQTFSGTVLAATQAAVNLFLTPLHDWQVLTVQFNAFQRGALTQYNYTIIYRA
jgi:hypothetical protein